MKPSFGLKAKLLLAAIAQAIAASASAQNDPTCPYNVSLPPQYPIQLPMPTENPCAKHGTGLVALTGLHVLFICEKNQVVDQTAFSMGRGGTGKTQEGDLKTPLGKYNLAHPHDSPEFGLFIPVGYPTAAQRKAGLTGADVGIHGPSRPFRCAGFLNVKFDWTAGCLAVADDPTIQKIAQWLHAHPQSSTIDIE